MKKILSLALVSTLTALFLGGCPGDQEGSEETSKFKACEDANDKGEAVCVDPYNFEGDLHCAWASTSDKNADEGNCTLAVETEEPVVNPAEGEEILEEGDEGNVEGNGNEEAEEEADGEV